MYYFQCVLCFINDNNCLNCPMFITDHSASHIRTQHNPACLTTSKMRDRDTTILISSTKNYTYSFKKVRNFNSYKLYLVLLTCHVLTPTIPDPPTLELCKCTRNHLK